MSTTTSNPASSVRSVHGWRRHAGIVLTAASVAVMGLMATGCTTTTQDQSANSSPASQRAEINAGADATLSKLYASSPDARQLVAKAKGVLIFPSVIKGGFVVGAQYGRGVLRVGNRVDSYYSTAGGSFGFQAGAQSTALVFLFMTDDALAKFRSSSGWTAGADATVAVATVGVNGSIDTNTMSQPVIGFALNNVGLMAGVSIEGTKVTRLTDL